MVRNLPRNNVLERSPGTGCTSRTHDVQTKGRRVNAKRPRASQAMENATKTDRLNLRVTSDLRQLFQVAADLENKNLTAFILEAARVRAEQRLADQDRFAVSPERVQEFLEALERPPRHIPRLQQLMNEPSVLERDNNASRTDSPSLDDSAGELR